MHPTTFLNTKTARARNITTKIMWRMFSIMKLFEDTTEVGWDGCLKLHGFASGGMEEAEAIGMEAETMDGVVAIAIFYVAANGMAHICGVDTNLILTPRLETKLYKAMVDGATKHAEMANGVFASIINWR